jgi:general secretion pathway protein G
MNISYNKSNKQRALRQSAFTLIELLIVLIILAVLAAIVVPKFAGRTEQARVSAAVSQIAIFGTALDTYEVDMGSYPQGKSGLTDLVVAPRDGNSWKGPYLKGDSIPLDPWGNAYVYEYPGKHTMNGYDITCAGPDGKFGTDDDLANYTTKR